LYLIVYFQHCVLDVLFAAFTCSFHLKVVNQVLLGNRLSKGSPLPKKGTYQPNSWMDPGATWYGERPRPWPHCARCRPGPGPKGDVLDGDPAPLTRGTAAPAYRPMTVLAKRLDGSRCHLVRR